MGNFYSVTLCFLGSKKWGFLFAAVFSGGLLLAQKLPEKTMPLGKLALKTVKPVRFPKVDNQKLLAEELEKRKKGLNPSFAITRNTSLKPSTHGE